MVEVQEIIEQADIIEYVSQFTELEKRSDGEYWGLSPLQDENTPSFSVSEEMQRFYDFSSGQGGNLLDFIRLYHQCDFFDGLRRLKEYAHITEDCEPGTTRLLSSNIAKRYRGGKKEARVPSGIVLAEDYMDRYDWDEDMLSVWHEEGISWDAMKRYQVRYDPVSERIVFPIRGMSGEIINVSGRTIDPRFKEKGLRKYTYFKPLGTLATIYGLQENMKAVRAKKEIILFEGVKSVMMAYGWGVENCGAILTSHLNQNQFKILIKLGVRIVFALDSDVDIRKDANIMKLLPYTEVEWVKNFDGLLEDKESPVDRGREVFERLYERRVRLR